MSSPNFTFNSERHALDWLRRRDRIVSTVWTKREIYIKQGPDDIAWGSPEHLDQAAYNRLSKSWYTRTAYWAISFGVGNWYFNPNVFTAGQYVPESESWVSTP